MQRPSILFLLPLALAGCASAPRPLTTIAYRPDGKLGVVPVTVGGQRQWFMWDSGAPRLVIDPRLAAALGLVTRRTSNTTGTGQGAVAIAHVDPVPVEVGGVRYIADDPWVIDLSGLPTSKDVRGLIGADLWSRYAVRMDAQAHTLQLFAPGVYRPGHGEVALPLIVEKQKLYVDATLEVTPGRRVVHRLRIDTGSEDSVNDPLMAEGLETRKVTLGNGLGASYQAVSGRIAAVHLGPFTVRDVWGPGGSAPAIGMEMLRRFIVTFDAPAGKLYLRPTAALREPVPPPSG